MLTLKEAVAIAKPHNDKIVAEAHAEELLRAARNLLAYRHCLRDGAGRKQTNDGIERAITNLERAAARCSGDRTTVSTPAAGA